MAAGNDYVTFGSPFDEADSVMKSWSDWAEFVGSVRKAFIDADVYDPDEPSAVYTIPSSTVDAALGRSADKLIEQGVDPDDAEAIAAGAPELYDAVVDGDISVEAAVEIAELAIGQQRDVLSTDLDSDEIIAVLEGKHGKKAKIALTEGHNYRVRVLMLDEETRSAVHTSDVLPIILGDEDHLTFEEIESRVADRRAEIVAGFEAQGLSADEAQAAYDDVVASIDFLGGDTQARMALDGGDDEDSKPGDPDADNKYGIADAQARAMQLLEDDETSNGQRIWQRAIQGRMGTPNIFVADSEVDAGEAEAFIEGHKEQDYGSPARNEGPIDSAAAEVQAIRRTDPEAAAALELAIVRYLDGDERQEFIEAMAVQTRQEKEANDVLGQNVGEDFEVDQEDVDAEVERIIEESTELVNPTVSPKNPGPRPTFVDPNEAAFQINELAKTDPALAFIVKQQIEAQLSPEEAAELNRLIADPGVLDDLESGQNHPVDQAEGAAKGTANDFIFIGNAILDAKASERGDGKGWGDGVEERIPEFELENSAQRGGAHTATIIETAMAGRGLIKIGGKWFIRNGDELTEVVDTSGGALRAKRFGDNWTTEDLDDVVKAQVGPEPKIVVVGRKRIYKNPDSSIQIIEDLDGGYFRIEDTSLPGKRRYLDIDGKQRNNTTRPDGKQRGRTRAEYQEATHFKIDE